jgi:hypothetical protein
MTTYFQLDKRSQLRLLAAALLLAGACGGGGGGGTGQSTQNELSAQSQLPDGFAAAYYDLRDCLAAHGVSSSDVPPGVEFRPTVTCDTGSECCITPTRGGEEVDGVAVLPQTCDQPGNYMAHAYQHEALHAVIGDSCHTSPLWRECWDGGFHGGCTAG